MPSNAGDVLVSGGLGALGVLVASWAASVVGGGGRQALRLLSRSGRPADGQLRRGAPLHALLAAAGGGGGGVMVTLERCDAAAAEEAAAAVGRGGRPVGTLLHAAGVLKVGCCAKSLRHTATGRTWVLVLSRLREWLGLQRWSLWLRWSQRPKMRRCSITLKAHSVWALPDAVHAARVPN